MGQPADAVHNFPGRIGLVLIAATHDGFAVAGDGAQANADGTASEVQKVFQVGKYGAIALAGSVSIQDPIDRPVREEINISRIAKTWLDSHPDAGLETANREINSLVTQTLAKFFSTRHPGAQAGKFAFAIICAGFVDGKPFTYGNNYFTPISPGKAARAEKIPGDIRTGEVWVFGTVKNKLHAARPFQDFSVQEFVDLFDAALRDAESEEGKKTGSSIVAPPNRFATISVKDGFTWKK